MKRIIPLVIFALVTTILIISCSKTVESLDTNEHITIGDMTYLQSQVKSIDFIEAQLNAFKQNENKADTPPWLEKVKKWIIAHSGIQTGLVCGLDLSCGPCAGFCLFPYNTRISDDSLVTNSEYQDGKGAFGLNQITDSTFLVTFETEEFFVMNDTLYVPDDIQYGSAVADSLDVNSFTILKGVYPVLYGYKTSPITIIDVDTD